MSVGKAVGVSVESATASVGGMVAEGRDVSVGIVGEVGGGEEQEVRRERKRKEERRMRERLWRDMGRILTELP